MDPRVPAPVLLLQETAARHRVLPVWVGSAEAYAIELERQHLSTPRPTTHQLIGQVISSCGHRLQRVCVTMVRDGVFHAELVIGPDVRVSARVSDAVALALHVGVPVQAADDVLDQAALDDVQVIDVDAAEAGGGPPSASPAGQDAELEEFRRFLDHTRPEDFGTD
jgi:bifunctional DNase/RNase